MKAILVGLSLAFLAGLVSDKVLGEPCAIRRCYQKDECVALLNSPIGIYKKNYRCECKRRGLFRWGPLCSEVCGNPVPRTQISLCDSNIYNACEEVKYLTEDGKGKTEDQLLKDCSKSDSEFGLYFCEGACQARYKSNLIKANCANNKCTCDYCVKTGWQHDS